MRIFTSKDENLNKAHIRHLEGRLIQLARAANRVELENGNLGSLPPLSEPDRAEAEAFLAEMLLIYPVLGVQAFERAEEQPSTTTTLFLNGPGATGEGVESADGFVVYEGSLSRPGSVPPMHAYGKQLREALLEQGVLVNDGDHLRFTTNYSFNSPSLAAMVLLGRIANGRIEWKTPAGVTLKDLQAAGVGDDSPE